MMSALIKHYLHTMQNIPQLSNTWGSMIALLDAILVTGFNHQPIGNLTHAADSLTATISFNGSHGYIDRQIIRIKDSTNGWDGDYKVLAANTNSIVIECDVGKPLSITGIASCSTAPLDFEIVHTTVSDSATPKRAYRSNDPDSLGLILLVHDFCISGAAENGAKFAKVGVVSSMGGIDNITGVQLPFDPGFPNANWGWDGEYHGWAKWYYSIADGINTNTIIGDNVPASAKTVGFTIAGSAVDGFVIQINNIGQQAGEAVPAVYGFLEFNDDALKSRNLALLCFGVAARYKQNDYLPPLARSAVVAFGTPGHTGSVNGGNLKGALWFNTEGAAAPVMLLKPPYLSAIGQVADGVMPALILSDMLIIDSNQVARGVLPFVRTSTQNANLGSVDATAGKYINVYGQYDYGAAGTRYAITLEVK